MSWFAKNISGPFKNDKLLFWFCLFIFTVPIMKTPDLPLIHQKFQLSELVFIPVFLWFGMEVIKKRVWPFDSALLAAAVIHLGCMALDLLHSGKSMFLRGAVEIMVQSYLFLIVFISAYIAKTRTDPQKIFSAWSWALVLVMALGLPGLLLYALGYHGNTLISTCGIETCVPPSDYPRVQSTFRHPSYLANYMAISFFFLAYLREKGRPRLGKGSWFWVWCFLFAAIGFLTLSRSFLIWIVVLIPWAVFRANARSSLKICSTSIAAAILAFIAFITVWLVFPLKLDRENTQLELANFINTKPSPRMEMWKQAWASIERNPLWGRNLMEATGPAWVAGKYYAQGVAAHNTWLQLWATRGILGLISFLFFLAMAVRSGWKNPLSLEQKFLVPALIALFLISFIEHLDHVRFVYILLGLFIGFNSQGSDRDLR